MAPEVRVAATKAEDVRSVPGTHMVGGENRPSVCLLTSVRAL